MITLRPAAERGHFNHGWLNTYHTFSFSEYHDPRHVHFRALRVINEDFVAPGQGFGTHPHRDMEILTYVLEGALEHRDSLGTRGVIRPGDVQRMSAGSGILHSEYNHSKTEPVHLLQIWIMPESRGIEPGYEQQHFSTAQRQDRLRLVASPAPRDGAVKIHTDAEVYAAVLSAGKEVMHTLAESRGAWIQVARGSVDVNGKVLAQGDGAAVENEAEVRIRAAADAEILLFDLG